MIDNLDLIWPMLHWENDTEFYFVQVLQRRKDWNTNEPNQHRVIKDYYIYSWEQLEKRYPEIKELCKQFNARAYIRLSRRDARTIAKDLLIELGDAFRNDSYKHLRKIYSTAVGRSNWLDKIWIIDIDCWAGSEIWQQFVDNLSSIEPVGNKILLKVPTKNWLHVLTKPFNLEKRKLLPENRPLDVHKNSPTLLYF